MQSNISLANKFALHAGTNKFVGYLLLLLGCTTLHAQKPRLVLPIGHRASIWSVAFSPDGQRVLTSSEDHTAKLWDLKGHELQSFEGHKDRINSVAFSPDGKWVLTGSEDYTAKLWDLQGHELQSFEGHENFITRAVFSPDGRQVLTGSWDESMKLWDLQGQELLSFETDSLTGNVYSLAFSPDGRQVLFTEGRVQLWDLESQELRIFEGLKSWARSVAFSPDNQHVLGSDANTAKLWDIKGHELQTFEGHRGVVWSVAFSPDGRQVLTGSADSTARLWDLEGQELQIFEGHTWDVLSVAFSQDGQQVLTGCSDGTAKLWDLQGQELCSFEGRASYVESVSFSPDGQQLLGIFDRTAKLWDMERQEIRSFEDHAGSVYSAAFSPDGQRVLGSYSYDGIAKLWDLKGQELQSFEGHRGFIYSLAFSPDGRRVLTGSIDDTAKLWDLEGEELQSFDGHTSAVKSVAFSPDGRQVLTSFFDIPDSKVSLWDLQGHKLHSFMGRESNNYKGAFSYIKSPVFSHDGQRLLGVFGRKAILWDIEVQELDSIGDDKAYILSEVFPWEDNYVPGSNDHNGTAQVSYSYWEAQGLHNFEGHTDLVNSAIFSPDGQQVLTGSDDGTAKLWNLEFQELQSFEGHVSPVESVSFSPDGNQVLTSSSDHSAKLWDTRSGREIATLINIGSTDWIVTNPSGLFDASPRAMDLLHFVVTVDGLPEAIGLEQLKERYYEPGLLSKLRGIDPSPLRDVSAFTDLKMYPKIAARIHGDSLYIQLKPRNGGIGKVSFFINNKEVIADANETRDSSIRIDLTKYGKYYLAGQENKLAILAYNEEDWLKSQAVELSYLPQFSSGRGRSFNKKTTVKTSGEARLYAVVVGTTNYSGEQLDLQYPDKDAAAFAAAMKTAGKGLFPPERIRIELLTTDKEYSEKVSSKSNIQMVLKGLARQARPEDILILYLSGHGVTYGGSEKGQFYYLTKDIASEDLSDPEIRNKYAISSNELTEWLTAIPALKQVLILDACNSGRVVEELNVGKKALNSSQIRALDRMKDRTGMYVLSGSAADKVSYEASQYGQGLLTYSILQGMKCNALTPDQRVDVFQLFEYARDEVPELAKSIKGVQRPMMLYPTGGSFDIGIIEDCGEIELADVKPVFIRSNFQNDLTYDDELELSGKINEFLRLQQEKSEQIIFVDVSKYEGAYRLRGQYEIKGAKISVKGHLFKGKEMIDETIKVNGNKDDLDGLVKNIIKEAGKLLK